MGNYSLVMGSLVALGSGQGSTIEFVCKKIQQEKLPLKIKALITENPHSNIVKVAEHFNIPCHIVEYKNKDFKTWDKELCHTLFSYQPRLIVLAGFLKKIGPETLNHWNNKIINSHPALLPDFGGVGMYGLKVHQAVIREKKAETGVSIHIVNQDYDKGRILAQKKIPVKEGETAEELEKRVKKMEKIFYLETILKITQGEIPLP